MSKKAKEVVLATHAESTVRGYRQAFARWRDWAETNEFVALPASPVAVSLYLVDLMERSSGPSPITSAVAAIRWAHEKACLPIPVDKMVEQVVAAARRQLAQTPRRKEPLKKDQIGQIVATLTQSGGCLNLRTAVMVALGFAGFMRWNDMEQIKVEDLLFKKKYMEVTLRKRKNDQLRQGSVVLITRQDSENGAVELCERLIREAKLLPTDYLLANLVNTKDGWRTKKGVLQYSRARELLRDVLIRVGLDPTKYGLHSLRSGGTTAAAAAKVPHRLLKRHGGWHSEAISCYIQESLDNLLLPSDAASW